MIINMLFVKTISDNNGNTYDKILNLKSDNVFANIISGNLLKRTHSRCRTMKF
ncbi:hypothetical protein [Mycoplasmopsis cynos]|uniref:hypothetical protein n=1 Tax=Mycoplasmopsis cynos TaxID=171284 RepID=UPI0024C78860|nr:hypothetical protein [Mycoplasmopsis cynos]WAM07628.1 hypothetical protein ONA21_05880 [Mycoplasmopsis cynos]